MDSKQIYFKDIPLNKNIYEFLDLFIQVVKSKIGKEIIDIHWIDLQVFSYLLNPSNYFATFVL
jgi:hypothetical protein